jgi:hypothetical protein
LTHHTARIFEHFAVRASEACLGGVEAQVGSFLKSTAPAAAAQSVTGIAFTPAAILLASVQNVSGAPGTYDARFGLGAATALQQGSTSFQDTNGMSATQVNEVDSTTLAFQQVDNSMAGVDAGGTLTSLDTTGFTLTWSPNEAGPCEIEYVALAVPAPDAGAPDAGSIDGGAPDAGVADSGIAARHVGIGCDCSAVAGWTALPWIWLLARPRRPRRAAAPSDIAIAVSSREGLTRPRETARLGGWRTTPSRRARCRGASRSRS